MGTVIKRGAAWRAMIRMQGQSRTATFDTEREANTWIDRTEAKIRAGAAPPPLPGNGVSVADLFVRYGKEISPKKRGERWEVIRLGALTRSKEFDVSAASFDGHALAQWRDRRLQVVSAATVNRDLNLISAVFSHAKMEWRLPIAKNPVSEMKRPPQPKGRTRRVSDDERDAIVQQLGWSMDRRPDDLNEFTAWAFCFAIETAMRQGEILSMTWKHIRDRSVHLPRTKNGEPRDVPLSSGARKLLALLNRGKGGERVLPLTSGTCGAYFREAVRGACLNDLHFHDSRHEAVTRLATKLSIMDLARMSGHKDTRQLMGYYHPTADDLSNQLG